MSLTIMSFVWKNGPSERSQRLLLLAIADNANDQGVAWPSTSTLAAKACMTVRTVSRTLAVLEKEDWLKIKPKSIEHRGNTYQLNLARLSATQSQDKMSHDNLSHDILDQVTGHFVQPPTPPIRKNHQEPSFALTSEEVRAGKHETHAREKAKRPLVPKSAPTDPRHAEFRIAISEYWKSKNALEMPWDGSEAKSLSQLLQANPKLKAEDFKKLLRNRFRSDCNHSERPRVWLGRVTDYAAGPLDRFSKPISRQQPRRLVTVNV